MKIESIKNNYFTFLNLLTRNVKLFFKAKAVIFFSFLAPLILLMLYTFFLKNLQVDTIIESSPIALDSKKVNVFVDAWLIAGVMSLSSLTVALNACTFIVYDKENKIMDDFNTSAASPLLINLSYLVGFFILTLAVCLTVLIIGITYLSAIGYTYFTFSKVLNLILVTVLSCLSSVTIMMFIASIFENMNSINAFMGIFSAVSGFLIGAYMPSSIFPNSVQTIANLIPGSHCAVLYRNLLLSDPISNIAPIPIAELTNGLSKYFSLKLNMFNAEVSINLSVVYIITFILIFSILCLINFKSKKGVKHEGKN